VIVSPFRPVTVSVSDVVCTASVPIADTSTLYVPMIGVFTLLVSVIVDDWPEAMFAGLNVAVTPLGNPVAVSIRFCAPPLVVAVDNETCVLVPTVRLAADEPRFNEKSSLTVRLMTHAFRDVAPHCLHRVREPVAQRGLIGRRCDRNLLVEVTAADRLVGARRVADRVVLAEPIEVRRVRDLLVHAAQRAGARAGHGGVVAAGTPQHLHDVDVRDDTTAVVVEMRDRRHEARGVAQARTRRPHRIDLRAGAM